MGAIVSVKKERINGERYESAEMAMQAKLRQAVLALRSGETPDHAVVETLLSLGDLQQHPQLGWMTDLGVSGKDVQKAAILIQKLIRGHQTRQRLRRQQETATVIQRTFRGHRRRLPSTEQLVTNPYLENFVLSDSVPNHPEPDESAKVADREKLSPKAIGKSQVSPRARSGMNRSVASSTRQVLVMKSLVFPLVDGGSNQRLPTQTVDDMECTMAGRMSHRGPTPAASRLLKKAKGVTHIYLNAQCDLEASSDQTAGARGGALLSHRSKLTASRQSTVPHRMTRLVHSSAEKMSTVVINAATDLELALPSKPDTCTCTLNSAIQRRSTCTTPVTPTVVSISERSTLAGLEPFWGSVHENKVQPTETREGNDAASADQNDHHDELKAGASERKSSLSDLLYQEIAEENAEIEDFLQPNLIPAQDPEEESEMKPLQSSTSAMERVGRGCQSPYGEYSILVAPPDEKTLLKAAEFRGGILKKLKHLTTAIRQDYHAFMTDVELTTFYAHQQVEASLSDYSPQKVLLISSRVAKCEALKAAVNPDVLCQVYDFAEETLPGLLGIIGDLLNSYRPRAKAKHLGIVCKGGPGYLYLLHKVAVTPAKLRIHEEMQDFWRSLGKYMSKLNPGQSIIHLMESNVTGNKQGEVLLTDLEAVMFSHQVKIRSPLEIGPSGREMIALYFDPKKHYLWKSSRYTKFRLYKE